VVSGEKFVLMSILFEAHVYINYFFPLYSQKILNVVSDPEIPENIQLIISISAKLNANEAFDCLKELDEILVAQRKKANKGIDEYHGRIWMSFDWTQYLFLARELTKGLTSSSNHEAKLRSAISRARLLCSFL